MSRFPLQPGLTPGDIGRTPAEPPPDDTGAGDGEPEQLVSFYFAVLYQRPEGNRWVDETRTVVIDAPVNTDAASLLDAAEQEADSLMRNTSKYGGFVLVSIQLVAPTYYQYFRGF